MDLGFKTFERLKIDTEFATLYNVVIVVSSYSDQGSPVSIDQESEDGLPMR